MPKQPLDEFTTAYIECALWSSTDESTPQGGEPLDKNYGPEDIHPDSLGRMRLDCEQFQRDNEEWLYPENYIAMGHTSYVARAGHDFWLTRNGHGAGFWDGDWSEDAGNAMSRYCNQAGESDLYVGDDGQLYVMPS